MKRVIWIGLFAAFIPGAYAQTEKPAAQPDVLILTDGEKLIGQFEKATDTAITFKSTVLGEVSVNWEKVQEIQSSQKFALIPKNVTLRGAKDASSVPVGTISIRDQKVQVTTQQGAEQQPVPVSDVGRVVDQADFEKALQPSGFLQGWSGGATGGIALTESTQ